jgi:hypothetical protein
MITVFKRARVEIDVFGALLAEFADPLFDVLVGHLGLMVVNLDSLVFTEFDGRNDLEFGFEAQRLALFEMDFRDIRAANRMEVFGLHLRLQSLRDEVFNDLLPDLSPELLPDEGGWNLAWSKSGDPRARLDIGDGLGDLGVHFGCGHGNLERTPATFKNSYQLNGTSGNRVWCKHNSSTKHWVRARREGWN